MKAGWSIGASAAIALTVAISVSPISSQAAGRSGATDMSKSQKSAAIRGVRGKMARCKREANRKKIGFTARTTFMKQCLARR